MVSFREDSYDTTRFAISILEQIGFYHSLSVQLLTSTLLTLEMRRRRVSERCQHQSINLDSFTGILHASILNPPPFCALKFQPEKKCALRSCKHFVLLGVQPENRLPKAQVSSCRVHSLWCQVRIYRLPRDNVLICVFVLFLFWLCFEQKKSQFSL